MMTNKNDKSSMVRVRRLVILPEKKYTRLKRSDSSSVDYILAKLADSVVAKTLCPLFKQWTHDQFRSLDHLPLNTNLDLSTMRVSLLRWCVPSPLTSLVVNAMLLQRPVTYTNQ